MFIMLKTRNVIASGAAWMLSCMAFGQAPATQGDGEVILRPAQSESEAGWALEKQFTNAERQQTCKKYEGQYISYYSRIYRVENCKRRELVEVDRIISLSQLGKVIQEVPSDVIAQLDAGKPVMKAQAHRGCNEFEGEYVTFNYVDVYLVESCRKRLFPDWATVEAHQKGRKRFGLPVMEMTPDEFYKMRAGKPMPSILDKEFAALLKGDASVDIIPALEACSGLAGRTVSFYSRLYRIENCRKREYNTEELMRLVKGRLEYTELTAQQWLSIPNGAPMPATP